MPVMTHVNLSLPETLKSFVDERVESGSYQTVSDYMQALICDDQAKGVEAQEKLELMLMEGIESLRRGEGVRGTPEMWEGLRERFRLKHGRELGAPPHA